jgi:hypothetical protein
MIKKLFAFIFFVGIPLLLAVPGYMGWQTQIYMENTASYISTIPGYKAQWQSYNRGWFESEGVLVVELSDLDPTLNNGKNLTLPVNFELLHGPVLYRSGLGLGWFELEVRLLDKQEDFLKDILITKDSGPIYKLNAEMNLLGSTKINDRWLPFEFINNNQEFVVSSYAGKGQIGFDRQLTYEFTIPNIRFRDTTQNTQIEIHDAGADTSVNLAQWQSANVAPGEVTLRFKEVSGDNKNNPESTFTLNDVSISAVTWLNDLETLFGTRSNIMIKKLSLPASGLNVDDLTLEISYSNISLVFLEKYQSLIASKPVEAGMEYWQKNVGNLILADLLPASPKLAINSLTFRSLEGKFEGKADISIEGEALKSLSLNPENPLAILPYLVIHLNAIVDRPLVDLLARRYVKDQVLQQLLTDGQAITETAIADASNSKAQQLLHSLVEQNIIVQDQHFIKIDFNYSKGEANLNGQPMPLPF